jgi:hypothetical protein
VWTVVVSVLSICSYYMRFMRGIDVVVSVPAICPYYMRFMRGIGCCSFRASYLSLLYEVYERY